MKPIERKWTAVNGDHFDSWEYYIYDEKDREVATIMSRAQHCGDSKPDYDKAKRRAKKAAEYIIKCVNVDRHAQAVKVFDALNRDDRLRIQCDEPEDEIEIIKQIIAKSLAEGDNA